MIFCGQHDIDLRGHRDDLEYYDSTSSVRSFQDPLNFRVECGDAILEEHFETCPIKECYVLVKDSSKRAHRNLWRSFERTNHS